MGWRAHHGTATCQGSGTVVPWARSVTASGVRTTPSVGRRSLCSLVFGATKVLFGESPLGRGQMMSGELQTATAVHLASSLTPPCGVGGRQKSVLVCLGVLME